MSQVIVTGSVAYDHIMSMPGRFKDHIMPDKIHILNVSFNVDRFRKEKGGTAGNQVYNLSLLGIDAFLVAAVGKDFGEYEDFFKKNKINTSGIKVFEDEITAQGFVVADKDDNQVWIYHAGAMMRSKDVSLKKHFQDECLVVIGPNDPRAMKKYVNECSENKVCYLFDPAFWIADLETEFLVKGMLGAKILIGNDYEVELMIRKTGLDKKQILKDKKILITTLGSKGSSIEQGNKKWQIPAAKPESICDPTGAGDAYRAGFLAGYLKNLPNLVCGRMGAVAAAYTVEKYGTQTHYFSLRQFKVRYEDNFGEKLSL